MRAWRRVDMGCFGGRFGALCLYSTLVMGSEWCRRTVGCGCRTTWKVGLEVDSKGHGLTKYRSNWIYAWFVRFLWYDVSVSVVVVANWLIRPSFDVDNVVSDIVAGAVVMAVVAAVYGLIFPWQFRLSNDGLDVLYGRPSVFGMPMLMAMPLRVPWNAIRVVSVESRCLHIRVVDAGKLQLQGLLGKKGSLSNRSELGVVQEFVVSTRLMGAGELNRLGRGLEQRLPVGAVRIAEQH